MAIELPDADRKTLKTAFGSVAETVIARCRSPAHALLSLHVVTSRRSAFVITNNNRYNQDAYRHSLLSLETVDDDHALPLSGCTLISLPMGA
ncbi:MAG TPA: hypothetical protein VIR56_04155 [Solimonas sp.]